MKVIYLIVVIVILVMLILGFVQEFRLVIGIYVGLEGGLVSYVVNDGNDGLL